MIEAIGIFTISALIVGAIISPGEERDVFFGAALVTALIVTFAVFV